MFIQEDGIIGYFTREQAEDAIPNGSRIVKTNSEQGDGNPDGTLGTVLGSVSAPGHGILYFVAWDTAPVMAIAVAGVKVAAVD